MREAHADIARNLGYSDNQIHMLTNGEILEFDVEGNARKSKTKIPIRDVIIDGRTPATAEGQRVLTDRKIMSTGGAIVVVLKVYKDSKRLVGDPDVISRGLIYGSEQEKVSKEVVRIAKKTYEEEFARKTTDRKAVKRAITGALYRYFNREIDREPMIVPLVVEV